MLFSSIKEINRYAKHFLLRKTDVLKTSILSERKFEQQKGATYIWGNVHFSLLSSAVFRLQNSVSDFF